MASQDAVDECLRKVLRVTLDPSYAAAGDVPPVVYLDALHQVRMLGPGRTVLVLNALESVQRKAGSWALRPGVQGSK